jgi:hypothetical protein
MQKAFPWVLAVAACSLLTVYIAPNLRQHDTTLSAGGPPVRSELANASGTDGFGATAEIQPAETHPTSESVSTASPKDFTHDLDNADPEKLNAMLTELTKVNPHEAARLAESMASGDFRIIAMRAVSREWARTAPKEALAWAATLGDAEEQRSAREFICFEVEAHDPVAAITLAQSAGYELDHPFVANFTTQWAMRDVNAARNWALALPTGDGRERSLHAVFSVLANTDPAAAAQFLYVDMADGVLKEEAGMAVLEEWAKRDISAASQWVARFPPGELRSRAEAEIAKYTAQRTR